MSVSAGWMSNKNLSRRSAIALGVGGVIAAGAAAMHLLPSGEVSQEEFETIYSGEDEVECEEGFLEDVTAGELAAHIACAISMSAIGSEDYDEILDELGVHGRGVGEYEYHDGNIMQYIHDSSENPQWVADHPDEAVIGNWRGDVFVFGTDEIPDSRLPNATTYINWVMGKGCVEDGFTWIDPRDDSIWEDAYLGKLVDDDRNLTEAWQRNRDLVDSYAVFAQCGAVPNHIHTAMGLKSAPLWPYFYRTIPVDQGGSGMSLVDACEGGSVALEDYTLLAYDPSIAFDDFCKPGDMLVWMHGQGETHFAIYVGNEIAQRYFPNTTGNVCEAGASGRFAGIVGYPDSAPRYEWLFVCRPRNIHVDMRQDLPPLQLEMGCVEELPMDELDRICYEHIRNVDSPNGYITAVDYDNLHMAVFSGSAGRWRFERSCEIYAGPTRYFGYEGKRNGRLPTVIGTFHLPTGKYDIIQPPGGNQLIVWCVAYTHGESHEEWGGAKNTDYIHAVAYPPASTDEEATYTHRDFVADGKAAGEKHYSGGCIEPVRDFQIWWCQNVSAKGHTVVVFTEEPASAEDGFESEALKQVMVSRGYHDVSQLTGDEALLATPNK